MSVQLFMSHTKHDKQFCDSFDIASARVGIKIFRSEFESFTYPAWETIKDEIKKSSAVFLLVGKELVKFQNKSENSSEELNNWKYTQNWIAYEIGLASALNIDVWVYCDNVEINFPIPYVTNYAIHGIDLENPSKLSWIKYVFTEYKEGRSFPFDLEKTKIFKCHNKRCQAVFALHSIIEKNEKIICPTCLSHIPLVNGWGP